MWWSRIPQFFTFPLSFKIISFHIFGKASMICNQYIWWVTLRWNSIFQSFQGFIFPLSLNNWLIKFKIFVRAKMYRLTINPNIWVKPNELREDYGWKSWFWVKLFIHFIKISWSKDRNFERMSLLISILLWDLKFLPNCLPIKNSGIIFQSWKSSSTFFIPPIS